MPVLWYTMAQIPVSILALFINSSSWLFWIEDYRITQIILAVWFVLAYDLLETRRTIDVIITQFFLLCFKMAKRFENLDNNSRDWAKEEIHKKSCGSIEQVLEAGRRKKPFLVLGNGSELNCSNSHSRQLNVIRSKTKLVSKLTLR